MKTSIFYYIILLLIIVSCKQESDKKTTISTKTVTTQADEPDGSTNPFDGSNCWASYQIYGEAAFVWQASWVSYYNFDFNTWKEVGTDTVSPSFSITPRQMSALRNENIGADSTSGVFISYIIDTVEEGDKVQIPGIAVQNVIDCTVIEGNAIAVYYREDTLNGGTNIGSISSDSLQAYRDNWKTAATANPDAYSIAEGYIYSWKSLDSIKALTDGMTISYGLRTLEPGEAAGFTQNNNSDSDAQVGSVVYCNVLYGGENEQNTNGTAVTLRDFALPCPRFCDPSL